MRSILRFVSMDTKKVNIEVRPIYDVNGIEPVTLDEINATINIKVDIGRAVGGEYSHLTQSQILEACENYVTKEMNLEQVLMPF